VNEHDDNNGRDEGENITKVSNNDHVLHPKSWYSIHKSEQFLTKSHANASIFRHLGYQFKSPAAGNAGFRK
jgi:hypothetical protein